MAIHQEKKKKKNWEKVCKKIKISRKNLRKKLDKLWAEIVKQRANNVCEYQGCSKVDYLNAHHIFGRSNLSVRWDLNNGACLCPGHHTFNNYSAHKAPIWFIEWIKDQRGIEWYEDLIVKANEVKKWTIPELKELVETFKKEIISEGDHS